MNIWDPNLKKHIRKEGLTVQQIEDEVLQEQMRKEARRIGPFEFDTTFD
jgi:hypothetical protein